MSTIQISRINLCNKWDKSCNSRNCLDYMRYIWLEYEALYYLDYLVKIRMFKQRWARWQYALVCPYYWHGPHHTMRLFNSRCFNFYSRIFDFICVRISTSMYLCYKNSESMKNKLFIYIYLIFFIISNIFYHVSRFKQFWYLISSIDVE